MRVLIALAHVAFILQASLVSGQGFTSCTYSFDCTANTNMGVIRLSGAVTDKPYQTANPLTSAVYYWKPCDDFTLAGLTAGAIEQTFGSYSIDIGNHDQAFCDVVNGNIRFNMMSADYIRFTYVRCQCGGDNVLTFESESPFNNFNLVFSSNVCCPNYSPTITVTMSISPGAVLLIIFFSVVILYFLFGTIFQVAIRKAEGRERVPNMSLWSALPGLIKDGFIFTFTCGRKTGYAKV